MSERAYQDRLDTFEITLKITKRTNERSLNGLFTADHAYGPVERVRISREDHHANVGLKDDESIDVVAVERVE